MLGGYTTKPHSFLDFFLFSPCNCVNLAQKDANVKQLFVMRFAVRMKILRNSLTLMVRNSAFHACSRVCMCTVVYSALCTQPKIVHVEFSTENNNIG